MEKAIEKPKNIFKRVKDGIIKILHLLNELQKIHGENIRTATVARSQKRQRNFDSSLERLPEA